MSHTTRRLSAGLRRALGLQTAKSPLAGLEGPVVIRYSRESDQSALERLAVLDSKRLPPGSFLLAIVGGELVAAAPLDVDAEPLGDPFRPTEDVRQLLTLRHLLECRELADRFGYDWLAAWSRSQLATLDLWRNKLEEARELLDELPDNKPDDARQPEREPRPCRVRTVGARGARSGAGGAIDGGGRRPSRAYASSSLADVASRRGRAESSNTRGARA